MKNSLSLGTYTKSAKSTVLSAACNKETTADLVESQTFTYYLPVTGTQLPSIPGVTTVTGDDIAEINLTAANVTTMKTWPLPMSLAIINVIVNHVV